ncbi:DDE-type integrase/transposase/recombinase [Deinococcus oregonensis]|uniref:DDE-type integrase/transposase/recombinase n=1 Tax=Deinococcus oregonensis TaxID=1805970 RepID=A0ABV6ASG8_9DEIO
MIWAVCVQTLGVVGQQVGSCLLCRVPGRSQGIEVQAVAGQGHAFSGKGNPPRQKAKAGRDEADGLWDEVFRAVDGVRHGLWRVVEESGFVQGILLEPHREIKAAKTCLTKLLGEYDVPEVIHTDGLRSHRAAIRELSSLRAVNHHEVISTARCNTILEQDHRSPRRQERSQQGFNRWRRAQEFLNLHALITNLYPHSRTSVSALTRRRKSETRIPDVVSGRGRGDLRFGPPLPSTCRTASEGNTTVRRAASSWSPLFLLGVLQGMEPFRDVRRRG